MERLPAICYFLTQQTIDCDFIELDTLTKGESAWVKVTREQLCCGCGADIDSISYDLDKMYSGLFHKGCTFLASNYCVF